ncbi:Predicted CoA-binding domain COG1832 [Olavius algarvensis spirochete endosymbiont]|uniref:CoA-binding protein n=1 Tax=Olavius algarvensis spirochete endosymbiont TaxID=260710 RepID=UPI000F268903|nr:CoA-binding protein [Olavius algarvensis spirochete endosymbiont]VDA99147.1 Predicted CoA-binding domain COG1832 [Olavius algarvensis spirochete endosymbiont]
MSTVVVLGASPKKNRYSNKAVRRLKEIGHRVIPVNPAYEEVEGLRVFARVRDVARVVGVIDTLTVYLAPRNLDLEDIIAAQPRRVIFNPGTESAMAEEALDKSNISWIEACTLVLLSTGQF